MSDYEGTGFSHTIQFSDYENLSRDDILSQYEDTQYTSNITGICTRVIDGDTIEVDNIGRVRLVGINTPETNALGYDTSRRFVEKLCQNQEVSLKIDSEKERDNYDRILAVVIIDNKNLNQILLREGLAEVMYIPPSEFNPYVWAEDDVIQEIISNSKTNIVQLPSTIINQKKQIFLYVSQSKNLVWPNGTYDYQIYVKNISGQEINNLKIYIANPKEVVISEKDENDTTYTIPQLSNGQSVLINVKDVVIMQEGYYYVNFVATADESEIQTQTLLIKCGYENDNKKTLHRIAFYNFSPYENSYMQRASDFSENVTQLTKIQTKPFEAYNQPFEMDALELDLYAQDIFLTNTDDMPSMYLGRENWESNAEEFFVGETLTNLISNINRNSDLVDIDFLRVGSNEMETNFQRIYPNGFIHRFGLMKSEFYKMLGIIPRIYSINDDLFRWARGEDEPIIYPLRENDKWNQKPWCGTGYYVYEHITNEDKTIYNIEKAIFTTKENAIEYINKLEEFNHNHFIENISYTYKRRDWLPGVFFVEIPLQDIPANFYIPSVDEIQATIELTKPYGLKGYPRFGLQESFNHKMQFSNTPTFKPHISFDLGQYGPINYHIRQRRYRNTENGVQLIPYGKQISYIRQEAGLPSFFNYYPKFNVARIQTQTPRPDDNSISVDMQQEIFVGCNKGKREFDGRKQDNSINQLIMKNPEDICFYTENLIQFNSLPEENQIYNRETNIVMAQRYKTQDYHNKETSKSINVTHTQTNNIGIRIFKQNIPKHIIVNVGLSNVEKTKDFIISYQKLHDDTYKISYKTYKNKETIVKEIVTQFNYILYEISNISTNKDLIKIYYSNNNKIYFLTAFTAHILQGQSYTINIALTNDLILSTPTTFNISSIELGDIINNTTSSNWYLINKPYASIISTDQYQASEKIKSTLKWSSLYKINKDETSFALFQNKELEETNINSIQLYLDNLNIPNNSIIDQIYIDLYADTKEQIRISPSYQLNTNLINETDNIGAIFDIDAYNIYENYNLKYLYNKLSYYIERENEKQIEYFKQLIDNNKRQNKNINIVFDAENPLVIKNNYWNEVSFEESTKALKTSDVKQVYLILEGYNHSNNVLIDAQLANYNGVGDIQRIELNTGYFYKRIPINYDVQYDVSTLNLRYKFINASCIDLYSVKAHVLFTRPQEVSIASEQSEDILINGINKYFCNICNNIDGDKVQNGLTIDLDFSSIHNYLKIYSAVVNIIYHEKAFTNIFEITSDFNKIDANKAHGILRGAVYDEDVSDMRQDIYTLKKPNGEYDAGFEMNHRIYQAFEATNDNITSIELKPNGKTGAPDNYLKIAIWDNYDNLPNNCLKEIIVNIAKNQPIDGEAHKYNICVNNLIIGDTYWFSIEPVDKTKNGIRRFLYSNYQIGNFKLISTINGDVINHHASLYFRLYTKANTYAFKNIPFIFTPEALSTKDINFVTELQIYNGSIQNFTESLYSDTLCEYIDSNTEQSE